MKTIELMNPDLADGLDKDIKGAVSTHKISEYICWIEINIQPAKDLILKLNDNRNSYLHFLYNLQDNVSLKSTRDLKQKKLSQFQSAIIHDNKGFDTLLYLKANGHYRVCIVQLSKYNEAKEVNSLFSQFEKVFNTMNEDQYIIHTGLPNLKMGEYVRKLMELPKRKLSDKLIVSGYINILLGIKLDQYLDFVNNPLPSSLLSHCEMERIKKVSLAIQENPEKEYTVDDLCMELGMSAAKLQMGFKEMHGKTVCNYITHIRLEKAEELLKSTDLNVSQIVYSLGWSSRSYFCKIFKQKYQCSPKNYQLMLGAAI